MAVAAIVVTIGVVRLSQGPLQLQTLKPGAERLLALQVPGGVAHIDRAELVYFREVQRHRRPLPGRVRSSTRQAPAGARRRSLRGRPGARDPCGPARPALGHIAAKDFFAAVSVSPQGRYQLGYDARGAAKGSSDLSGLLLDITGRPARGRPLSYLRSVDLTDGRVALREVGGPVAWTARSGASPSARRRRTSPAPPTSGWATPP